jgi:hypothetical protein
MAIEHILARSNLEGSQCRANGSAAGGCLSAVTRLLEACHDAETVDEEGSGSGGSMAAWQRAAWQRAAWQRVGWAARLRLSIQTPP